MSHCPSPKKEGKRCKSMDKIDRVLHTSHVPDDKELRSIQAKFKAAAYFSSTQLDPLLKRFGKVEAGISSINLCELKRAVRTGLKSPEHELSDRDVEILYVSVEGANDSSCRGIAIAHLLRFLSLDLDKEKWPPNPAEVRWRLNQSYRKPQSMKDASADLWRGGFPTRMRGEAGDLVPSCMTHYTWPLRSMDYRNVPKLTLEQQDYLRDKARAAATASRMNLEVMFAWFDKDCEGMLDCEALRKVIRNRLRVPPSYISDLHVRGFFNMFEGDASGKISIAEVVGFVETGEAGKVLETTEQLQFLRKRWMANAELPELIQRCRSSIKAAAERQGGIWEVLRRAPSEKPDFMDRSEFRYTMRRVLQVPPRLVTDTTIALLFQMLDIRDRGKIDKREIARFVDTTARGPTTPTSPNEATIKFQRRCPEAEHDTLLDKITLSTMSDGMQNVIDIDALESPIMSQSLSQHEQDLRTSWSPQGTPLRSTVSGFLEAMPERRKAMSRGFAMQRRTGGREPFGITASRSGRANLDR